MSNKEQCISIINEIDDSQLANIVSILKATKQAIDEAADDAFCASLYKQYEQDADKGECVSLEDAAKILGVSL